MISEINRLKRIEFAKNFAVKDAVFWGKVLLTNQSIPNKKEMFHNRLMNGSKDLGIIIQVHKTVKMNDLPADPQIKNVASRSGPFSGC